MNCDGEPVSGSGRNLRVCAESSGCGIEFFGVGMTENRDEMCIAKFAHWNVLQLGGVGNLLERKHRLALQHCFGSC